MTQIVSSSDLLFLLVVLLIAAGTLFLTRFIIHKPFPYFFIAVLGVTVGLILGSLLGNGFKSLPDPFGKYLPTVTTIFVAVAMLDLFLAQAQPFGRLIEQWFSSAIDTADKKGKYILDSSALIDGRLLHLVNLPLLYPSYVTPRFVVNEMQKLSDSKDLLKRRKGRRGLDNLKELQSKSKIKVYLDGAATAESVDSALIKFAKDTKGTLITLDSNLAKVAQIENVSVLNLNELVSYLKVELMPGDRLELYLSQKGRGHQAIGYLQDGTMIIVEEAGNDIGKQASIEVIKIHQTVNGMIYFATLLSIGNGSG